MAEPATRRKNCIVKKQVMSVVKIKNTQENVDRRSVPQSWGALLVDVIKKSTLRLDTSLRN